jgi:hypothetical protein
MSPDTPGSRWRVWQVGGSFENAVTAQLDHASRPMMWGREEEASVRSNIRGLEKARTGPTTCGNRPAREDRHATCWAGTSLTTVTPRKTAGEMSGRGNTLSPSPTAFSTIAVSALSNRSRAASSSAMRCFL